MAFSSFARVAAGAALVTLAPFPLVAQTVAARAGAADSGASHATNPWPQRGWVSVGVGVGNSPYHSLAAVAAGWYSVGPVAAGARLAGARDQLFGEHRGWIRPF